MYNPINTILDNLGWMTQQRAIYILFSNPALNTQVYLQHIDGQHTLNQGVQAQLLCLSSNAMIPLKQFIGSQVAVDSVTDRGQFFRTTGIITAAERGQSDGALTIYQLKMQDATALWQQRRNSRVFMNKSVVEVVEILFKEWQSKSPIFAASLSLDLTGLTKDYDVRPLIIQHNELDGRFLQRLLRQEAINFLIDEDTLFVETPLTPIKAQKLCLIDDNHQFKALERRSIRYQRSDATEQQDNINHFIAQRSLQPTAVYVQRWQPDYLEQQDGAGSVQSHQQQSSNPDHTRLNLEHAWHFSPAWMQDLKGEDQATASSNAQIEQSNQNISHYYHSAAKQFIAQSSVRDAQVGYWFELHGHPEIDLHQSANQEFLIISKTFYQQNNLPKDLNDQIESLLAPQQHHNTPTIHNKNNQQRQGNHLTLQRRNINIVPEYHPLRHRSEARPMRARVVGPSGEEIHVDAWGRIKVRFLFTRPEDHTHDAGAGSNDNDTDSAWIDVLTPWAGEGYGARFLPRIGEIVVIDFFDGNIDRPFVLGRLHEGSRSPTQFDGKGQLPDTKQLSGIRSKEIAGSGYGQLRFDDTTGQISSQLQSSHGASQLNLGKLSHPKDSENAEDRGEGFELRTDQWGALRAANGILISTEASTNAQGAQLDREHLKQNIAKFIATNSAIRDAAIAHQSTEPELTLQESIHKALPKWDVSDASAFVAIDAKDSLILDTEQGIVAQAKDNIDLSTERNVQIFSGRAFLANVLDKISLFAKAAGIKIKAGQGPIEIESQADTLKIASQELMHIYAINDFVKIESGKGILITAGGGYIKLENGNIDLVCPGLMTLKAGQIQTRSGSTLNTDLAEMPKLQMDYDEIFVVRNKAGKAMPNMKYRIKTENGKLIEGVTDAQGRTEKVTALAMTKAVITLLGYADE